MLRIRGRAATYGELWYDERPPDDADVDILVYRNQRVPMENARNVPGLSLTSDLTGSCEQLESVFARECRYEIRRADSKDGVRAEFFSSPRERLGEFAVFHAAFADQKVVPAIDEPWLRAACDSGKLILTCALRDSEVLVWHAYLRCGPTALLLHSISLFRERDTGYRALVGRVNRWLHWRDMHYLKTRGAAVYDWGGLFEDDSAPGHAGINRFKRSFGGSAVRYYDCTVANTLKGRLYLPLRDAWRRYGHGGRTAEARKRAWQPC
jgi:hypothetical protein